MNGQHMRVAIVAVVLALAGCSSVHTTQNAPVQGRAAFAAEAPYAVSVSAANPQLERLIREYVADEFGRTLQVTEGPGSRGTIEVTYTSAGQGNAMADWQNSTMLVVIRAPDSTRLWSAEYDYKGGMELSGFKVTTPAEAAKLVVQRLAKNFEATALR